MKLVLTLTLLILAQLSACASLPPGSDYPRTVSTALEHPELTRLGQHFEVAERSNASNTGLSVIPVGAEGFLVRMQMINSAERTLDLQYFIFHGDETGALLTDAVLRAADRGVRVRVLVDDGETQAGDEQILALEAHDSVEVRIFNPFAYRGHVQLFRVVELLLNFSRLNYRMHNKLMVVDNSVALMGGRNIGDQYFQIDPESQFADDDVFVAGPVTRQLSATFVEFWNSGLSIPAVALSREDSSHAALTEQRRDLDAPSAQLRADGFDYVSLVAAGEPFAGLLSGNRPLVWAPTQLASDSPDKKRVEAGERVGRLMRRTVADATLGAEVELLMVTPYFIPGVEGMQMFRDLRRRGVRVRILTNSLESSTVTLAQAGYMHFRKPLLKDGVEINEIRSLLGSSLGSGQTSAISHFGNYSLHAKLFVIDRKRVYIGSMNFDQRSMHLNTEIGLIIDSPELAQQVAARFDDMAQSINSYGVMYQSDARGRPKLVWRTRENDQPVNYYREPARSRWQRLLVHFLALLPLDSQL
jgi:cardiolipin synthase C